VREENPEFYQVAEKMIQEKSLTETTPQIAEFILSWKRNKGYSPTFKITLGECQELLVAITPNLHIDFSDGRFFNKSLINAESSFQWDGDEPIVILFYEIEQNIIQRSARQGTLNDTP
jgi:hypothetical protein